MKAGQARFASFLCCGWFLLTILHCPVYSANEGKPGSPRNVNDLGNGDTDDTQSFKTGRKFGFPSEFSTGRYLSIQRRLLGDNASRPVATEKIRAGDKIQESVKNQTNSEIKDQKPAEKPLLSEIQATNDTINLKEKQNLEIVENEMHKKTGENNSVAKSANKDAEEIKIEAEKLSVSTTGGVRIETAINSTEIGIRKIQGNEAQSSANHTDNLEPAGSLGNSTDTEIPGIQSPEANRSINSTEIPKIKNSTDIEMQRMETPAAVKTQTANISEAEAPTANSTSPELQGTESIPAENSTNLQNSESQGEATGLTNPTDSETPDFQSNNGSANSANATDIETQTFAGAEDRETPADSTDTEMQEQEDEYGDLMQDFADLPSKLQDTAGKVADKLMPGIQRLSNTSKVYFDIANQGIAETFKPLIGKQYAPVVASAITCILLLLPIILAIAMFDHVRAFFPLQKVVFLANVYLTNYFATLVVAWLIVGMEPMLFLYRNSLSGYICLQLVGGLGYALYALLQCLNAVVCCVRGHMAAKAGAAVQCVVSICIGLHYYVRVFHRAMAHQPPRTSWKVQGAYALMFLGLALLSKPKNNSGKKQYMLDGNTNKNN